MLKIIEDALELCRERFINQSIDLRTRCGAEIQLECRPTQTTQILMNLLSNAYDTIAIQQKKWVSIDVTANHEKVTLVVTDSGKGIPKDVVEKVMQPFFSTKPVGRGTGLGLSISKMDRRRTSRDDSL